MSHPRILIVTPFRNEAHSIDHYLKSVKNIDYPKKLIDLYWLENDSSDNTFRLLKRNARSMGFNSTSLKRISVLGKIKKNPPKEYFKDVSHNKKDRTKTWMTIWNNHFIPLAKKSRAKYVLAWYADCVAPSNVITEYLKVFKKKPDAGWVAGSIYRRYPRHNELHCPIPTEMVQSKKIVEVTYLGHCWMMPRKPLTQCKFHYVKYRKVRDTHMSLIDGLKRQGLKVYYQPSVFLKHVSSDGKIYRHKHD